MDLIPFPNECNGTSQLGVDDIDPTLFNVPKNAIVIHNITAHSDFGVPLDFKELRKCLNNAFYAPHEFSCVRVDVRVQSCLNADIRRDDSRGFPGIENVPILDSGKDMVISTTVVKRFEDVPQEHLNRYALSEDYCNMKASLFSNGKVSITGGKSLLGIAVALEKICRAIRKRVNKAARVQNVITTNILAVYNYNEHIVLKALEKNCKGAMYDPFRFSGVRIRFPVASSPAVFNIRNLILTSYGKTPDRAQNVPHVKPPEETSDDEELDAHADEKTKGRVLPPLKVESPHFMPCVEKVVQESFSATATSSASRNRNMKKHLHRFLNDVIPSNKRKIHQASIAPVATPKILNKRIRGSEDSRVWLTENKVQGEENTASKDEVVTINVFTSGNVTFTGARSIASIQMALSFIHPYLVQNTASRTLD